MSLEAVKKAEDCDGVVIRILRTHRKWKVTPGGFFLVDGLHGNQVTVWISFHSGGGLVQGRAAKLKVIQNGKAK